ncbi:MAG: hypothetical protein AB7Q97_25145 [Gammaproteobacteria bacterium]
MTTNHPDLLTPADDGFHPGDGPFHTEGSWWSFLVPDRGIGGWIYHLTRRNLGVASGGVWIWDPGTRNCFEAPYFLNQSLQPLGPEARDLNDFRWADGTTLKTLEPLRRYRLAYEDGDRIALELEFEGVAEPFVAVAGSPAKPFRFEQLCRVRGSLALGGERIAVDCLGMRDHSWGTRLERAASALAAPAPGTDLAQRPVVYLFGHAAPDHGFFVMGPGLGALHGYIARGGRRLELASSAQRIERDPGDGHIARIEVTARDEGGRELRALGTTVSFILRPSGTGVALVHLVRWEFDGTVGWGELQDVWPCDLWARYRRAPR